MPTWVQPRRSPRSGRLAGLVGVLVIAAAFAPAGCRHSPTQPTPPPPPPPPGVSLVCPINVDAVSLDGQPAPVNYSAPTVQGGTAPFTVTCAPDTGTPFDIGTTQVACGVTDGAAQTASCGFDVNVTVAPRIGATRYVAFGDSVTEGVVSSPIPPFRLSPTESYPTKLLQRLSGRYVAQTFTVFNAGIAGEAADTGLGRLPDVLRAQQPEILLLLEGANDLIAYRATPHGAATRAANALEEMVKEASRSNVRVYLATLPPWRDGGPKNLNAELPRLLNDQIRALARNKGAVLVDLYEAMIGEMPTLIGQDGLHPTEVGYERIAQVFFDVLKENLEIRSQGSAAGVAQLDRPRIGW